ncbi:cobyrinate a,c-diamide synthase [Solidesulfovibrio carbinolicus]|uniref:Cobyrinate a,c-diamide synthase n=1 Tax=Solidesulfovibrio carbinolicus TaxID=296842 RepID=A0A4P6HSU7_9BACT|nr:cobyrinate a,c-diamide synthase [Solidesulfovibrio carbinolicus]QAZ68488.1 cobyrinate a,c-diamide synthase [Solidesulfovibrio carbinolicus]
MTHDTVPALVVAGVKSGCGKTSVALGLMRSLARRGRIVAPFKAGPDFIDPGHHALAAGRTSHNLDAWMCGASGVADIYERHAAGADAVVVEGVMGLFDGFSATEETGSTAELAKLLDLPVLLVIDAASMARSVAALARGFVRFDPQLRFCGVALNNAGSPSHAALLAEAFRAALPDVPLWGVLPRTEAIAAPSRHLGLVTAEDSPDLLPRLDALADWLETSLDLSFFAPAPHPRQPAPTPHPGGPGGMIPPGGSRAAPGGCRAAPCRVRAEPGIGVACDRAFSFYYGENLRLLEAAGARIVPFSPLDDAGLPEGLGGLYFGGGYPELHADTLAANAAMRRAVREFCIAGRPVYAECGGFMYLMESLVELEGRSHGLCGVFPMTAVMGSRFAALGYREVTTRAASCLGPAGTTLRGHEFHYSRLAAVPDGAPAIYAMTGRGGVVAGPEGFVVQQTLGSYVHLHFGSNPAAAAAFVAACAEAS